MGCGSVNLFNRSQTFVWSTLRVQVDRLKPRFRQFILNGCKELDTGTRDTPLCVRTPDLQGNWSLARRGQDLEGARKSLAFEADENTLRSTAVASDIAQLKEDSLPTHSDRLQEIRRRMGGLGARETGVGGMGAGTSSVEDNMSTVASLAPEGEHLMGRYGRLVHLARQCLPSVKLHSQFLCASTDNLPL